MRPLSIAGTFACAATISTGLLLSACAGRPISAPIGAGSSALGLEDSRPANAGALRQIFSAPNSSGSTYTAQTFDLYQVPEDTYQSPDSIEITPQGQTPPANSGGSPSPLPYGIIVYPDGSTQTADANGAFTPANSSYVQHNASTIEADPSDGIDVTIQDPSGQAQSLSTQVQAGTAVSSGRGGGQYQITDAVARANAAATGGGVPFASIALLPRSQEVADGTPVPLSVVALDGDGHAITLNGATIAWSLPAGGVISQFTGGSAIYLPPTGGTGTERLSATIDAGGGRRFVASTAIIHDGSDVLDTVRGTLAAQDGAPPARSTSLAFLGAGTTPFAPRPIWFGHATGSSPEGAAFAARLPTGATLVPFAISESLGAGSFAAAAPGGGSSFTVPSTGSPNVLGTFQLESAVFAPPARAALPPVSTAIHDVAVLARFLQTPDVYASDSGLQPLLAAPFARARGTVASGSFAGWAFEWGSQGGSPLLTLLELRNGSAGTHAATVAPLGDGATYQFTRYRSAAALSAASPLLAAQNGAIIDESGAWSQPGGGASSQALAVALYDAAHPAPAAPAYSLRATYAPAGGGTPTFSAATIYDAAGAPLWSFEGTRSGRIGDGTYRLDAALTRATPTSAGPHIEKYRLTGSPDGNGGSTIVLANIDHVWQVSFTSRDDASLHEGSLTAGSQRVASFHTARSGDVRAELYDARVDGMPLEFPL